MRRRLSAIIALWLAALALVGPVLVSPAAAAPIDDARAQLARLTVRPAGSMAGYDRDEFPHWLDPDGNGCDAREDVLIRDGSNVRTGAGCAVLSGTWRDPYGGGLLTRPSDVDVDHFVPLANAWRSGASGWSAERRRAFANDPFELLAVDDGLNQEKGDKGPEAWLPPLPSYRVTYAIEWVGIKYRYHLSVTGAEKSSLSGLLNEMR